MCGIAGKINFSSHPVTNRELSLLSQKIAHRGPDDEGMYIAPNRKVGLVNRRLAIIDLSPAGHQPMTYRHLTLTFNGEIYNYQELRKKLIKSGVSFHSHSDTEVILALYAKHGSDCLKYLRGMFALAIYDAKAQTVFIARDRLGKKPLKYFFDGGTFIFASELKAILTQSEVRRQVDWLAIHYYLTFGYCPAPFTGFKNIHKLEPGHFMLVDLKTAQIKKTKYWHLDFNHKLDLSEAELSKKIIDVLEESTRLRMIADVPIGVFLSGGIDSSLVTALMARNSNQPIKTFTIGFRETAYDETEYAQQVAELFHTDHTVLTVDPQSIEILPQITANYEEPFADSSAIVTYLVSQLASRQVKVVINGDGGDENFAGYLRHVKLQRDYFFDRTKVVPTLAAFAGLFSPRSQTFSHHQQLDIRLRYLNYNSFFTRFEKKPIYTERLNALHNSHSTYDLWLQKCQEAKTTDVRDQLLYADLGYYFPDDLLAKVDIASMSVGLEARSPFTDHKMVELAAQIPYDLKVKNGQTKYILKVAAQSLLPDLITKRPKMGFSIPLAQWFTGELNSYARSQILNHKSIISQLFEMGKVKDMLKLHSVETDFGPKLWSLLTLHLWWKHYFDS